ncbi:DNA helicase [Afifella sp. IM 167]|nr:UvrD-helicase domain-containing protein [Afifella sp. IM 167]MBZ8134383.1 DNA helicase [Afifella sp. IM 167]
MTLRIADSFTASLAKLTPQEQGLVKQTAFDLHSGLDRPGLSLHRVDGARDKGFWTARVNDDIRIVLHRRGEDTLLAYVGHHDDAYRWAERRRLDVHPKTGAAQLVEIRERVEEVVVPVYVAGEAAKPKLFAETPEATLLLCGVPEDWIGDVRKVDEDTIFALAEHLPAEAMEALLNLAVGIEPVVAFMQKLDPFAHPDAQRRFHLLTDETDLRRALEAPWETWSIFLHPAQREFVERNFAGPARVIGSAGTGKTVVALHRAVRLARENPAARILLTTFNSALATALRLKVKTLVGDETPVFERITVADLPTATRELFERTVGPIRLADEEDVARALAKATAASDLSVDERFLLEEWKLIVDGRQIQDRETYRDLPRLGRKKRLAGERRETLWTIFENARESLRASGLTTYAEMLRLLADGITAAEVPFDYIVVDEAQDILAAELRILGRLAGDRPNGLFFAGDIGQRIFRPAFSWRSEGVDVRGRSRSLRVNYRTSQQIRRQAEGLLPSMLVEVDGSEDDRLGVQSLFSGPTPVVRVFPDIEGEKKAVAAWLSQCVSEGMGPSAIALVVRSSELFERAEAAAALADLISGREGEDRNAVRVAAMHDVKGLEFRAVAVMACEEGVIPSEARMVEAADEGALAEVYATERHLLYVACTRARENLLVTAAEPASEFLQDLHS